MRTRSYCADENGITNIENFSLSDILMNESKLGGVSVASRPNLNTCPACGFTVDDLRKIARLGCSSCYQVFADEVQSMVGKMHKGVEHKGKVPDGMLKTMELKKKFNELETEFKEAIKNEEFERAGELKVELAELKKQLALEEEA